MGLFKNLDESVYQDNFKSNDQGLLDCGSSFSRPTFIGLLEIIKGFGLVELSENKQRLNSSEALNQTELWSTEAFS